MACEALGGEASWKREGSFLRKCQEMKRSVQILGHNRYLHCWQSFQTSSAMWIHLFMPVPASVRHTSHSEKKGSQVPLSTPPHICSLPSRQTNQPNAASRRNAEWYGPMKITTQPPAQSRAASKWHRTFSHEVLRVSRDGFSAASVATT